MRISAFLKILVVLIVAVLVAGYVVLKTMDFDEYRGMIAEQAKAATGRDLEIRGSFDLKLLTLTPALAVDDIRFANAPWGSRPEMVRLKRLEVEVAVVPLFSGELNIKRLVLVEPDILLETDETGRGNWVFEAPAKETPESAPAGAAAGEAAVLPVVNVVHIEDARLAYRDGASGQTLSVSLEDFTATAANVASPLHIKASGAYNGQGFGLTAKLGALALLMEPGESYPLSLNLTGGGAEIGIEGEIADPMAGKGLALDLTVAGEKVSGLSGFAGAELPAIGPYRVSARLSDPDGSYRAGDISLRMGDSNLTGEVTVRPGERLFVEAKFDASLIDMKDFVPPAAGKETAKKEAAKKAEGKTAPEGKGKRLFSAEPLPLDPLRAIDAKLGLRAARILVRTEKGTIPLEDLTVDLSLNKGILVIKPFRTALSGGEVNADLTLNASQPQSSLMIKADVSKIDVGALLKDLAVTDALAGRFDSTIRLGGKGESMAQIMAGLQGNTLVVMENGTLENSYFELLSSDIVGSVTPWAGGKDTSKVNCVVSRFDIKGGLAASKTLLVDTSNVSLTGEGSVNLASEEIDFTLTPHTRDVSLISLAVPIRVKGTLAEPYGYPDMTGVAKEAVGAVGDAVTGAAALPFELPLGLLGIGGGEKAATGEDICKAAISGKKPKPKTAAQPAPSGEAKTTATDTAGFEPAPAETPAETGEPEEVKGPVKTLIEGVGEGVEGITKGLKGLFD